MNHKETGEFFTRGNNPKKISLYEIEYITSKGIKAKRMYSIERVKLTDLQHWSGGLTQNYADVIKQIGETTGMIIVEGFPGTQKKPGSYFVYYGYARVLRAKEVGKTHAKCLCLK